MYVLLVYDISLDDNGARVLRNVFKIAKKYLHHVQNSVFEGEITEAQIYALKAEIKKWVRSDADSVLLFKSREKKWLDKEFWGKEEDKTSIFL